MRKIVETIGKRIIDEFFNLDSREYDVERDELTGTEAKMSFHFRYSTCDVSCDIKMRKNKAEYLYVYLYPYNENHKLDTLEEAVNDYVSENLDVRELFSCVLERYEDFCADEWQSHGFRNEADYWHYRLGA